MPAPRPTADVIEEERTTIEEGPKARLRSAPVALAAIPVGHLDANALDAGWGEKTIVDDDDAGRGLAVLEPTGETRDSLAPEAFELPLVEAAAHSASVNPPEAEIRAPSSDHSTLDEPTVDEHVKPLAPQMYPSTAAPGGDGMHRAREPSATEGRLTITGGNDAGRSFELVGRRVRIGRAVDNDVVLTDLAVSRHHSELDFDGRCYTVRDLGSGNGTLLNDRFEDGVCQLCDGDRIELGNTAITLEHPATRPSAAPLGWGQADDVDEEASTLAGRSPAERDALADGQDPRPQRSAPQLIDRAMSSRLVLPASPPGAGGEPVAPARLAAAEAASAPASAPAIIEASVPQPAARYPSTTMSVSMPRGAAALGLQVTGARPPQGRTAVLALASAALAAVIISIVVVMIRDEPPAGAPMQLERLLPTPLSGSR